MKHHWPVALAPKSRPPFKNNASCIWRRQCNVSPAGTPRSRMSSSHSICPTNTAAWKLSKRWSITEDSHTRLFCPYTGANVHLNSYYLSVFLLFIQTTTKNTKKMVNWKLKLYLSLRPDDIQILHQSPYSFSNHTAQTLTRWRSRMRMLPKFSLL